MTTLHGGESRGKREPVTRARPCEVCGGTDACSRGKDGLLMCRRREGPQPGFVHLGQAKGDPQWHLYRREDDPELREREQEYQRARKAPGANGKGHAAKPPADMGAQARRLAAGLTPDLRAELARALGLPEAALASMPLLGFDPDDFHGRCWTFPEMDADCRVVGLTRRYEDGAKKAAPGGRHGLYIPLAWSDRDGPLYLPEGPSDVLALTALGLPAVGRPSNMAGVKHLADLLKDFPADRPIIVLGEYDPLPDGHWPGRDGAVKTAEGLAAELGRPVGWALPPDRAKDVRAWTAARHLDPTCADSWSAAGESFTAGLKINRPDGFGSGSGPIGVEPEPNSAQTCLTVIPCSQLRLQEGDTHWLWEGILARCEITLFSALWKAGKTTLLAHLLKAFAEGGTFCGQAVLPSRVLYITEESEHRWAVRRDELGLMDHVDFIVRPFRRKPSFPDWFQFLQDVEALLKANRHDLAVMDTVSKLWPVRDENDAAEVERALMPLHGLTAAGAAVKMVHHLRKGDGAEATGTRGSGVLPATADTILELRRFRPDDDQDRRRVLTGYGRWDATPAEVVVTLQADGRGYTAEGDRQHVVGKEITAKVSALLPVEPPGWTIQEIQDNWKPGSPPQRAKLLAALAQGTADGDWKREGTGKKNSAFSFWVPVRK
jgi:AAA domain